MTFEELKNKTLEELIKKYNFANPKTLKHEIKKIGDSCYKFNGLFYEPEALKRDLIYYDYLTQSKYYDALEKLKIALFCHKIDFDEKNNNIYVTVGENKTEVATIEVFDEARGSYDLFIYDRNYNYNSINDRLNTLKIIKGYIIQLEKSYSTIFDDIYTVNPVINRKVIQKISQKCTFDDDTAITDDEIDKIIKNIKKEG